MNYWITTRWPPRDDDDDGIDSGVYVPEGRQEAASDMQTGDNIAVYETKSGRTEIRELPNGTTTTSACKSGREGMIYYGAIDSAISAIPNSERQKYADGSEIWWRWYAPISVLSRTGFVTRKDLLQILGYKSTYNLHGFGDCKAGLKKISESQFNSLVEAFHASRPIEFPATRCGGGPGDGGGEGEIHLRLKEYIASNPATALKEPGLRMLHIEYSFPILRLPLRNLA